MVLFVSGQCFEGADHLVENIHEADYLQVVFALPAGERFQLDHLPDLDEGQLRQLPDKFLHKDNEKFDVIVVEAQPHDDSADGVQVLTGEVGLKEGAQLFGGVLVDGYGLVDIYFFRGLADKSIDAFVEMMGCDVLQNLYYKFEGLLAFYVLHLG